jgi:hypothetical protein
MLVRQPELNGLSARLQHNLPEGLLTAAAHHRAQLHIGMNGR